MLKNTCIKAISGWKNTNREVKSGKDYKRHSALSNVLSSPNYEIEQAIVLCEGNVNEAGKTLYLPAYMVMFV